MHSQRLSFAFEGRFGYLWVCPYTELKFALTAHGNLRFISEDSSTAATLRHRKRRENTQLSAYTQLFTMSRQRTQAAAAEHATQN